MLDHARALKDEIIIGGMLLLVTYSCLSTYSVIVLAHAFEPMNFGGGAAALIGAIGGGQGLREWLSHKGDTNAKP